MIKHPSSRSCSLTICNLLTGIFQRSLFSQCHPPNHTYYKHQSKCPPSDLSIVGYAWISNMKPSLNFIFLFNHWNFVSISCGTFQSKIVIPREAKTHLWNIKYLEILAINQENFSFLHYPSCKIKIYNVPLKRFWIDCLKRGSSLE